MELGEFIAVAVLDQNKIDCPFCVEDKDQKEMTLEINEDTAEDTGDEDEADDDAHSLHNDSGKLAKSLGSPSFQPIENPPSSRTYYIWEDYWDSPTQSRICGNAHHLIPGDASLAKCTAILKWMARTVTVKSTRYTSAKKGMPTGQAPATVAPGVTVERMLSKTKGGAKVTTITTVDGNVFGKVEYDLNSARNGVWLPSNNAIYDWRRGTNAAFKSEYARRAMHTTNPPRQFHDAHKAYSDKIIEHLGEMETVLKKRAEKCIEDDHKTADENKKLPAPRILLVFLNGLSSVLKHKLVGPPSGWRAPYNTSARALSHR